MPDRETVIKAFEYLNWYFTQDDGTADKNAVKAWEVLLREQESQKTKWLKAIADNQLAHAPNETDSDMEKMRKTGIWYGLEIAYEILTEDSHE